MKAIVQDKYGSPDDVLELKDIDKPVVKDDDVLVRVHAASMHADVWHVVTGRPYILGMIGAGLRKPKNPVPGTDVAGRVESVGKNVTQFQPADEVFGESVRGFQWKNGGVFAEYASVPEDALALKPAGLTFEQAAAVPTSATIALRNLRIGGEIRAGQKVLINGAGGAVGSFAVQLAKAYGADVTGVDSTRKLDMLRSIGADQVIDYTQEDFTQAGERYDLILDVASTLSVSEFRRALNPKGTYLFVGHDHFGASSNRWIGSLGRIFGLLLLSPFESRLPGLGGSMDYKVALQVVTEFIEAGKITPVIDRTFPLSEVPEAIRYLEEGHAQGKIVITV